MTRPVSFRADAFGRLHLAHQYLERLAALIHGTVRGNNPAQRDLTADGTELHGWFLEHPDPIGVALYCHGNSGNVAIHADTLKEFQKDNPLPWPNIADESGMISQMWGVRGFPAAVLVDHHGVIRGSWRNGIDPTEVWAEVDKLVQAAEAP